MKIERCLLITEIDIQKKLIDLIDETAKEVFTVSSLIANLNIKIKKMVINLIIENCPDINNVIDLEVVYININVYYSIINYIERAITSERLNQDEIGRRSKLNYIKFNSYISHNCICIPENKTIIEWR